MKILFTKTGIESEVSKHLGAEFLCDFKNFIAIEHLRIKPFSLKNYSLIFSSVNAVKSFFKNNFEPHENFLDPKRYNRIYAVGFKTKLEIRKHGYGTYKVTKHASDLADFIIEHSQKEDFLHFCGNLALDILDQRLPLQNIFYKKVTIYKTNLLYPEIYENYDAVVFFSPSGVRSFAKFNSLENLKLFSIGQTTEKELKKFTQSKVYTSRESNLEDLLNIIKQKADS